jgi:hypothetical protein
MRVEANDLAIENPIEGLRRREMRMGSSRVSFLALRRCLQNSSLHDEFFAITAEIFHATHFVIRLLAFPAQLNYR